MERHIIECEFLPKGFKMKIEGTVYVGTGPELPPDSNLILTEEVTIQ